MKLARSCARWLLGTLLALALAGCGQKGPLYLPDKGAHVVTSPAAAPATPAAPSAPAQSPPGTPAESPPATPAAPPQQNGPPQQKKTDKDDNDNKGNDSQTPQTPQQ